MRSKLMINGIMIFYLFLVFPISASAAFTYYESFEDDTVNTVRPAPGDNCNNYLYNGYNFPTANCSSHIRNVFAARYGTQYLDAICNFVDCTDEEFDASQRTHIVYGRPSGWSPACNTFKMNDGTEYWVAWSNYIPSGYYAEYYSHMVMEFIANNTVVFAIYYGGDAVHGKDDYDGIVYYSGRSYHPSLGGTWADDAGTWVDWVVHVVWYDTSNDDTIMEVYRNGEKVYTRSGGANLPANSSGSPPILCLTEYNSLNYHDVYKNACTAYTRAGHDGDFPTPWRRAPIDEIRITENTIGTKGYCDVAAPIWAAKPAISYPTQNKNNMPTSFTAIFDSYSDHRNDPQGCFDSYQMNVQVDEDGGDWSTLVYDSGDVNSTNSNIISGLSHNTAYQMRVGHSSYNIERSTEYWGEWSSIVTFTTGSGSAAEGPNPPSNTKIVLPLLPDKY